MHLGKYLYRNHRKKNRSTQVRRVLKCKIKSFIFFYSKKYNCWLG